MKNKSYIILLTMLTGWINRQQQEAINFLMEENKILKHELLNATGKKRIILNDKQRRRVAILAKRVGRKMLFEISCVFSPDTLLKWFRKLAGKKYDGSKIAANVSMG
jgi:putative transposase